MHAAGPDRAAAEALADQLATAHARRRTTARGMTLQAFIHRYWLPGKQRQLRPATLESYQRVLRLHILPALGHVTLRDLRVDHAETLYTHLLSDGRLLNPKTVSQPFDRVVARTELPPITLHGLRHTHATLLLKAGVPLKVV